MSDLPTTTPPRPVEGQVWVPDGKLSDALTINRVTEHRNGSVSVDGFLPERCPCCDTLIRTESEQSRHMTLEEFFAWVSSDGASVRPNVYV